MSSGGLTVTLDGGPFDGAEVPVSAWGVSLVLSNDELDADNTVARYTATRIKTPPTYRFRGYDRVIARLPMPGKADRG